jgi:hypothetical protein
MQPSGIIGFINLFLLIQIELVAFRFAIKVALIVDKHNQSYNMEKAIKA